MTISTENLTLIVLFATLLAILIVPFITYKLAVFLDERRQNNQTKLWIFGNLMQTRHDPLNDEAIKSLNLIDVVFSNDKNVREAWGIYYRHLHDPRLDNDSGYSIRDAAKMKLLSCMARSLGNYSDISEVDLSRIYTPAVVREKQILDMYQRQHAMAYYQNLLGQRNPQPNATSTIPSEEDRNKMEKEPPQSI